MDPIPMDLYDSQQVLHTILGYITIEERPSGPQVTLLLRHNVYGHFPSKLTE